MKKSLVVLLLALSFQGYSVTDSLIVSCFRQGSANNCASVALIKAAMLKYGYTKMFAAQKIGDIYNVTFKNGVALTVSQKEFDLAKRYSRFEITDAGNSIGTEKDDIMFDAYLAYACIAKTIQKNGYHGCNGFVKVERAASRIDGYEDALIFITRTSFCTDPAYEYLGLKIKNGIQDYKGAAINEKGAVVYSWGHAVVAFNNQIDCHGEWVHLSTARTCYNKFEWFWILD